MDGKNRDEKDLLFSEDVIKFKLCESVVAINSDCSLGWWRKSQKALFENSILVSVFSAIELK